MNKAETSIVLSLLNDAGLPAPVTEYIFHPTRKWRFDFAWPAWRVALEIEGGVFVYGGHTRPSGFIDNMDKYNAAAALGWRVLRALPLTAGGKRFAKNRISSPELLNILRTTLSTAQQ